MEVIRFGAASSKPPILLIHGSYCGAWIWTKNFIPAFVEAGWNGAAISLCGHGGNSDRDKIDCFGLADYLRDILAGTQLFDTEPVLIGHSLGGYLAQKYALEHKVKGLVLLSSPSLLGLQVSMTHIATREPLLALQLGALATLGPKKTNLRVIGDALFNDRSRSGYSDDALKNLQRESSRAMAEMLWPDFRQPIAYAPTLALGGEEDSFVPAFEFRYEAQFWKGQCRILPNAPHALMLDACWPVAMKDILAWLEKNCPTSYSSSK